MAEETQEAQGNGTAVAMQQEPAPPAPVSDAEAFIRMIERAARDPNVDIDKMERLLQMQERVISRNAKTAYNAAFARMQPELPSIEKKGKSNSGLYGKWEDIQAGIQPVLARHGFALSFKVNVAPGAITVTAILHHEDGHDDSTDLMLPVDASGHKNNVQAVGSSVSYGKRYAACALLNIRVGGEDDDGKAAGNEETISDAQVQQLRDLIKEVGADEDRFLRYINVDSLGDIFASKFAAAVAVLNLKKSAARESA